MEFLKKCLRLNVIYLDNIELGYPYYIFSRYSLKKAILGNKAVIFIYPKTELESIGTLLKHIAVIKKGSGLDIVLVLQRLATRQKEYLLRENIPFVVENKQFYLPFFGIYLKNEIDSEIKTMKELLPASQLLYLNFIYRGSKKLFASDAVHDLGLTTTSVLRAADQLEDLDLLSVRKIKGKILLFSDLTPKELYEKGKNILKNPVKRVVYLPSNLVDDSFVTSGYSALSYFSMLNPPVVDSYAIGSISKWKDFLSNRLYDSSGQVMVEFWRYDPKKLSNKKVVDKLSLALSFKDNNDERVEEAVEQLLEDTWRDIDGCRIQEF